MCTVRGYESQLAACGQTFPDVKTFIYEAYLDHPNEQLVRFVEMLQDKDRMTPPGYNASQLMDEVQLKMDAIEQAEKHKALKNSKQDEVVALTAQVDKLTKTVNKFKKKAKKDKKSDKPSDSSSNSDGKGKRKQQSKERKGSKCKALSRGAQHDSSPSRSKCSKDHRWSEVLVVPSP